MRLTVLEVGSPVQGVGRQVEVATRFLDWHADQAETYPWEEQRPGVFSSLLVRREPVGVVGAIVPWNFPLGLTMPKVCPALLAGCAVVLKPAEETPLYAFLLAEVFEEAGLPPGVLNVVPADRTVSEELRDAPACRQDQLHGKHAQAAGSARSVESRSRAAHSSSAANRPRSFWRTLTSMR